MSDKGGFEDRLREARSRQGMDKPQTTQGSSSAGPWGVGFRAGVEVVSALGVGVFLGIVLDRWLGTWPWLFLLFFVLGSAAGILNVFRLFRPGRGAGG
ncbi:AtpZ/AtpI family protein [Dankookia sp. GCM10030260]|uniref:AtpZ/AtpI family protein n=1 Tax=Dankookia sp. GCM10030260 TaxID=3273390 RepID=UPI0036122813